MSLKYKLIILFLISSFVPFMIIGLLLYLDNPQILQELVYFAALLVMFVFLLGSTLSQIVTDPIKKLTKATTKIKNRKLSVRVPVNTDDEIGELATVFNEMMDQVEQTDKAKTEFVTLASHQLRTPLTIIRWYTNRLIAGSVKTPKARAEYLQEIQASVKRMSSLVGSLLDISRLELGTLVFEAQLTDLASLTKQVLKELKPRLELNNISLSTSYAKGLPKIKVDPKLMRVVLQNIISNAIDYSPNGQVTIKITQADRELLTKVSDTGYGIPKQQQSQIFTKLFRADNVRKKSFQGSGLGLYWSKAIVEKSGGRIWFESIENQGTSFYIALSSGVSRRG